MNAYAYAYINNIILKSYIINTNSLNYKLLKKNARVRVPDPVV